ncbi:MYXO-CTERM sorting domain-containing protein [Labilithrix luteola]|nr:MYXO-CTERM sorting domain-containing protein [Labilithrix luteola]
MLQPARALVVALAVGSLFASRSAFAEVECPAGSTSKSEGNYKWCEPSVCDSDTQCGAGEVCRPVALCMQIGTTDPKSDAGQHLVVTQRCGPDKSCPSSTTCSDRSRCIGRDVADRMGLLTPATAGSAGTGSSAPAAKSSCGCDVPGVSGGGMTGLLFAGLGLVGGAMRRRSKR